MVDITTVVFDVMPEMSEMKSLLIIQKKENKTLKLVLSSLFILTIATAIYYISEKNKQDGN